MKTESVQSWISEHKLTSIGALWATAIGASLAYSRARTSLKPSLRLIHARMHAQALILGVLSGAAAYNYYEKRVFANTPKSDSSPHGCMEAAMETCNSSFSEEDEVEHAEKRMKACMHAGKEERGYELRLVQGAWKHRIAARNILLSLSSCTTQECIWWSMRAAIYDPTLVLV